MNESPYQPPSPSATEKQFALGSCLLIMLMVAIVLGMTRQFELLGFVIGIDLCAALFILASFSNAPTLRPFSDRKLTAIEIGTLVAICLILHGLAMPPNQSVPHRRRPLAPAVSPSAQTLNRG